MKRVLVIGSGGAGKSTFARALGDAAGLPVVHLDSIYWKPGWQKTPPLEWERIVTELVQEDRWIMDGNFGGTRSIRIAACDTIVLLNIPRWICLYRVFKRTLKYLGRTRPDMADGCNEKIDPEFLLWVWNYPEQGGKRVFDEVRSHPDKRFVVLSSDREIRTFLAESRRERETVD